MKTLAEIQEIFNNDRFAVEQDGAVILEAAEYYAKVSAKIQPYHLNARGSVMGGAIFTLADFAFAVAANACGQPTVTSNSNISFLSSPKGKELIAEARAIKDGRSLVFYEVIVTDEIGTKIACVNVTGMHVKDNNNV